MEKKSERLEVRLGFQEKQAFTVACDTQGDTPSSAIRRFISGYTKRSDGEVMGEANRRLLRRYGRQLSLAIIASVFVAVIIFRIGQPLTSEQIFAVRDLNGDSILTPIELKLPVIGDDEPHGVMRVLDIDGSGGLEKNEFMSEGKMVFMVRPENNPPVKKEDMPLTMTVVEFSFSKDDTRFATYRGAIIEADKFDRLVVWKADGTNSIWNGNVGISSSKGALKLKYDTVIY